MMGERELEARFEELKQMLIEIQVMITTDEYTPERIKPLLDEINDQTTQQQYENRPRYIDPEPIKPPSEEDENETIRKPSGRTFKKKE